jgi:NitT/TauT family transport system permease protein
MKKYGIYEMDGKVNNKIHLFLSVLGVIGFLLTWIVLCQFNKPQILPSPFTVLITLKELLHQSNTYINIWYSVKLNLSGYLTAMLITIPFGFAISLFPAFRGLFSANINASRYLPLTAVTGLFIAWFGIKFDMKIYFMGFSILIYLLPAMIQRVDDIDSIHKQIIHTLGASKWQKFIYVYWKSTMPKFWKDVRLLVAISWTYIIVAELINKEGGVGAMIFNGEKTSRTDIIMSVLIIIIVVGMLQDVLFYLSHKLMFPHDYNIYRKKNIIKSPPNNPTTPPQTKKTFLQKLNLVK